MKSKPENMVEFEKTVHQYALEFCKCNVELLDELIKALNENISIFMGVFKFHI